MNQQNQTEPNPDESPLVQEARKQGAMEAPPDDYNNIYVRFVQFNQYGDTVHGRLIGKNTTNVKGGRIGKYTVVLENGERINFLGTVRLDEQLACVGIGQKVWIQYTHEETIEGGNKMKCFDVRAKQYN